MTRNNSKKGRPYFNSAVFLESGKKPKYFHKQLLPTGDVFDEARFIENGDMSKNYFSFQGKKIFLTICEDIWAWPDDKGRSHYKVNPISILPNKKVDLVLNLSASPYYPGKLEKRRELVKKTAAKLKAPMIYCNLVGSQDEIVFDGTSFALDSKGKVLMQALSFEEDFCILDLDKKEGSLNKLDRNRTSEIHRALVLGLRDFCFKAGLNKIHLGLSGGIDSAVVACLAVDALGPQNVHGFILPTQFNAQESSDLAKQLIKNLGIQHTVVEINSIFESFKQTIDQALQIDTFGLVHENLQSRIRGTILMAYSNKTGSLLLTTGNKSELATGYATLYGDMCGGLAPIGDLVKGQVYDLARHYNKESEIIPNAIITRAPTAELRPNQKDEDSLPKYDVLDASVVRIVEKGQASKSKEDRWLMSALLKSEFKRFQAPPVLKVSTHSFGRGRRWPIAMKLDV